MWTYLIRERKMGGKERFQLENDSHEAGARLVWRNNVVWLELTVNVGLLVCMCKKKIQNNQQLQGPRKVDSKSILKGHK